MKLLRYFVRGLEEIGRELGLLKRVVKPRKLEPPSLGRSKEVLRYVKRKHGLHEIALFDKKGSLLASSGREDLLKELYSLLYPLLEDLRSTHIFLRREDFWATLFNLRGFNVLILSPYQPDITDLWMVARDIDLYLWGYAWEG
ncbi:MAG: hypothetical protein GXO00_00180 [Candidatus Diapherotrites archaeon]|nr:hypothetical protein [Candidatus Diapherotrites archaeon]